MYECPLLPVAKKHGLAVPKQSGSELPGASGNLTYFGIFSLRQREEISCHAHSAPVWASRDRRLGCQLNRRTADQTARSGVHIDGWRAGSRRTS